MPKAKSFLEVLNPQENQTVSALDSPLKIQAFLDFLQYSSEPIYRCPLRVLRDGIAHCFDGAVFAAAALRQIGYPPLILDMLPNERDDDHVLALFKQNSHWGAVAKSNFAGLRYREPIFRNLRELVLSYFEQYYNLDREKTLRGYTQSLNLTAFDRYDWMTSDACMDRIADKLDAIKRYSLLTPAMVAGLAPVDERLFQAGLVGANTAGLFKPSQEKEHHDH